MRIISKDETVAWLSERGLIDIKGELVFSEFLSPIRFLVPVDSGKKTALSRVVASFFDTHSQNEALLWVNEFGIWPSCEDLNLFRGFRQSLGEVRPLDEKPGHVFLNKDLDSLTSLIAMILYFCWGAVIVSMAGKFILKISHDEIIYLYVKDKQDLSNMRERLNPFLKEL